MFLYLPNFFSFLEYANASTVDYVLGIKSKEFDEYLNTLTPSNILKVINNWNTPRCILDYIFKYKVDVLERAVDKAWRNDLEETIYRERNVQVLKMIYERRAKSIYRVIDKLYDFQLLRFLNLQYLVLYQHQA